MYLYILFGKGVDGTSASFKPLKEIECYLKINKYINNHWCSKEVTTIGKSIMILMSEILHSVPS